MAIKTLYIVSGLPATGKSTFATVLAKTTSACLIDIDTASEPIVKAAMKQITGNPDDRDSPAFKTTFREPIYETLFAVADANLGNLPVVVTGPFTKELQNKTWLAELEKSIKSKCRIRCIHLVCDESIRKERLSNRGNPRDNSKLESWDEHIKYYETSPRPNCPHLLVDTSDPQMLDLKTLLKDLV